MNRPPSAYRVILRDVLDELALRFALAVENQDTPTIEATGSVLGAVMQSAANAPRYAQKNVREDVREFLGNLNIPLMAAELDYEFVEVAR